MTPISYAQAGFLWLLSTAPSFLRAWPSPNVSDAATPFIELPFAHYNFSVPSFNASAGRRTPVCDGARAGRGLRRSSCEEAFGLIPSRSRIFRFALRDSILPSDVQVPRRYSSADGTCVIDVFIPVDAPVSAEYARWDQVSWAARKVITGCIVSPIYNGGYITRLGMTGQMIVSVSRYQPNVLCYGGIPRQPSFHVGQDLLDQIPTTAETLLFGLNGLPNVQVVVPRYFRTEQRYASFEAVVDTIRLSARGSWAELWAGAVAINAMCVGMMGHAGVAVMAEGLKITLQPRQAVTGNGDANLSATS